MSPVPTARGRRESSRRFSNIVCAGRTTQPARLARRSTTSGSTQRGRRGGAFPWRFDVGAQPFFAGFRDPATTGLDKPVLNVFRMLGRMLGDRVTVESSGALPLDLVRDTGVRDRPDVDALASRSERTI